MVKRLGFHILPLAVISLSAALFLPLFTTGFLYPAFRGMLVRDAEQEAERIAVHLASFLPVSTSMHEDSIPTERFRQAVKELGLLKVKVFSDTGRILFSTDPKDVGTTNDKPYFRNMVARGKTYSKTIDRNTRTLEGQSLHTALVETYVPVMRGSRFTGAFEIYDDISGRWGRFETLGGQVNRIVVGVSVVFLLAASLSLWKTHQALKTQDRAVEARRKADRLAETERARADAVMATMADGISIQDGDLRILYQNNAHRALIGDHVGEFCYTAYAGHESVCDGCPVRTTLTDGQIHTLQKTRSDGNGGQQHLELTASPLRDADGHIVAGIELVRDISLQKTFEESLLTEKERLETMVQERTAEILGATTELEKEVAVRGEAETALREALARVENEKAKTEGIIEAIGAGVAIHGRDFRILFQNDLHREMLGGTCEGQYCYKAYNGRNSVCPGCTMVKAFDSGLTSTFERDRSRLPGSAGIVEVTTSPLRNAGGEIIAGVELVRDITDRKEAETERERLTRQLQHSQKMEALGRLAGGIAHDFNNILTAVTGYGNLLRSALPQEHRLQAFIGKQLSAAEKATTLTRSLLAFGRDEQNEPIPVDVNHIIRNVRNILLRPIGEDVDLRCDLPEEKLVIDADPGQIELVLVNLATNARDAMPQGGRLTIQSRRVPSDAPALAAHGRAHESPFARITVSDTGCGIDDGVRKKIFEPFFTTKEKGRGTGLGLAIVYNVISRHKGFVTVDSRPGEGSRFELYLPITSRRPVEAAMEAHAPESVAGKGTILLAEDDPEVLDLFQEVLSEAGYDLLTARNGSEAVDVFKASEKPVDLLLFDVVMPKKNGPAAFEEIRAINPEIRAIFVSGYTDGIIGAENLEDRGLRLIRKPLAPDELLQHIREFLS